MLYYLLMYVQLKNINKIYKRNYEMNEIENDFKYYYILRSILNK